MTDYRAAWRVERERRVAAERTIAQQERLLAGLWSILSGETTRSADAAMTVRLRLVARHLRARWGAEVEDLAAQLDALSRRKA